MKPQLSDRERHIFELLNSNGIVSHLTFSEMWGLEGNTLNIAINRLRAKIAPKRIYSIKRKGYSLKIKLASKSTR